MEDPQQAGVTLDFSTAVPISGASPASAPAPGAAALGGSLLYAAQQDPVKYAKRLQLQKLTGIPPVVSEGNEDQVKVAADAKAINPQQFATTNPKTTQWAANPDNAAVSGVPEIQRLGGIEQNVKQMDAMYPAGTVSAYTPSTWESLKGKLSNAWDATKQNLYSFPLTRMAISTVGGLAGTTGDVASFAGLHGSGPTKQNMLQSVEAGLKPENVFKNDPYAGMAGYAKSNGMDQVAPLLASMAVGIGEGSAMTWAAKTFGWSEKAAKVATALSVGATFSAQQGGAAYTQVAGAGGDDDAARLAANRTFAINLPGNTLAGFADMIPGLRDNPLLASAGTGALMGASGQVGSNIVTGQHWDDGVLMAAGKGAAIQAGLHLGMSQFHTNLAQAVEAANASELKTRSPQTFEDAIGAIAGSGPSLRIPVEEFNNYFAGQKIDPQAAAEGLGSTNYAEAHLSGGDVEVPKDAYLAKLDQSHQMGLFPHIVDPQSDLTPTQWEQGRQELTEWEANGGTAKLQEDLAATQQETAASPEYVALKEELRGRYVAAGETPEVAETLATTQANVYTNLAREASLKPSELMAMYNPKVTVGDAPEDVLAQSQIPNWFRKLPAAAEGEDHPALAQLRDKAAATGVPLTDEQEGAAREAIDAASRGDDEVWTSAQQKYQELRDADPRTAELRAAQDKFSKLQEKVTENPTPESLGELEDARKAVDAERAKLAANAVKPDAGQPRGWFRALPDGSFEIGKTKIGDLSTFVHEPAHAYLFMLRDLAASDGASETLKSDYGKVLKFLDVKEGESLTTEQHEMWAQANEQYLREGKAPSAGLKGVFQRFAIWLGSVYQRASDLGVELSPEIREVFARMYAAEEGVNRAEAEAGPRLFKTPEEAGFTQKQFEEYSAANEMSVEQAKAEILGKLNEAAERDRTAAWREEQRNVRQAMTDSIDAQPAQKAIRGLRKGELEDGTPLTLNRQALVDQFGEDRVKALQDMHRGIYRNEGGTDAETAAELHGFSSGEEMVRAMEATPRRSAAIEAATREYMTAKHGDIRYDGTLGDQARLALENNQKANVLHGELLALKQKLAEMKGTKAALRAIDVAPIAKYRELAEQAILRKSAADLRPTRYLDASRKFSRESFEAAIKGDVEAAAEAKHKELLNHFLFREAQVQKEYVDRTFEPFRKRAVGKTVQESLGKAGPEYRAQFNNLMARYEVAFVPRSEAPEGTLAQWASNMYDMGKEPAIDAAIYNEQRSAPYRSVPISELRQVHDALRNIKALAYQELRMVVNGRKVEFATATADMKRRATESLESKPSRVLKRNATLGEKAADFVQRGDALLMRTERLMEWLDGGKTGPWHDNLWHLAADSQGAEYGLQEEVTKKIGDSLEALPKEQRMKMAEKVAIQGITEPITRHDLISMALNMGNDGNFDRLSKTFESHGWNPDALEQVKGALTREEWQHVQNLWEMLKPLGEHMKAMERRLTGVPPAMVKSTPFRVEFADGTHMDLDGGYYPIMMDPRFSKVGAAADAGMSAQNLMEAGYGRAETSKGYTKDRTVYSGPLLLDYEQVLTQHTAKVIKDITHREFMLTANKLLMDQGVRSTLSSTLGSAYEEQMMPWLRTIINDRNGSATQGLGDFSRWMRTLRTNMVMATIPFKIGTSLLQWTHAPRMLLSTNAGSFAQSLVSFMAHPSEMTQQIRDLSPNEMKFRGENLDRDMRAALNGQPGYQKKVAEVGGISIKYTDHLLSFPLWHSVFQDALKEHVDLPEAEAQYQAVQKADSAVRLGLGSASPKDLPPIMRNNDFAKFFTTFYSFHNGIYGQVRDIAHQVNGWGDVPKMTYGMALAVVVPSLIGSLVTGHGPKDDENVGLWAAKRALLFSSDTIPLVRDVAAAMDRGGDVKFNPLMDVMSKGTKAALGATADKDDKDWTGIGLNALETAGDLAGVPGTGQAVKLLRYLDNMNKGKIENPNVWDAFAGSGAKK
jgi:hypothetical protein